MTVTSRGCAPSAAAMLRLTAWPAVPSSGCWMSMAAVSVLAVDGEDAVARVDVEAGLGQRRLDVRRPGAAGVDLGDALAVVADRVVGAQQAAGDLARRRDGPAVAAQVADGEAGQHLLEDVVEVGAGLRPRRRRARGAFRLRRCRRRGSSGRRRRRARCARPRGTSGAHSAGGSTRTCRPAKASGAFAGLDRARLAADDDARRADRRRPGAAGHVGRRGWRARQQHLFAVGGELEGPTRSASFSVLRSSSIQRLSVGCRARRSGRSAASGGSRRCPCRPVCRSL